MTRVRTSGEFGALARAARRARGWSQQQAADAAGVSRRFVNVLENGKNSNAELWRVLALLDALGVELDGTVGPGRRKYQPATPVGVPPDSRAVSPVRSTGEFDLDAHLAKFRNDTEQQ